VEFIKILHFPYPVLTSHEPLDYFETHEPLSREELKTLIKSQGEYLMSGVVRRPFAGELVDFPSPDDETVIFSVKRCSVADNIKRQNLASTVRYVNEDDGARFVTERDYPVGDLKIATVTLALGGWNIVDDNNAPLKISELTITQYLSPREFDFIYEKALEVNPIWSGNTEDTKAD
jgi:hypothetical protein